MELEMKISKIITMIMIFTCWQATAFGKAAFLSGYDDILNQQNHFNLKIKLEKKSLIPYRTDLPGETIDFYLNDELIGSDITDDDGIAYLNYHSLPIGVYQFIAKISPDSRYKTTPAKLFHVVINKDKPIAISDIDHTLSDASAIRVATQPNRSIKPLKNASAGITFFNKLGFQIIYLTARDDTFILKTKDWLKMYDFLPAPSFYWDYKGAGIPQDHGDFKSLVIKKLRQRFSNILIGIGDKPHDIRAYRDHELRSYYIGKADEEIDPDGIKVNSWDEILEHFNRNPLGSLSSDPVQY